MEKIESVSAHVIPLVSFYTPWKHQKAFGFLIVLGGIETDR